MNEKELIMSWYNGRIVGNEKLMTVFTPTLSCNLIVTAKFFTSGTDILFWNDTLAYLNSFLEDYHISSNLLADQTGESLKAETKRLLIRNSYYKTAICSFSISLSNETGRQDEYLVVNPAPSLFETDQHLKKAIVSGQLKPSGTIMRLPNLCNEFKKLIKREMDNENADDCIILNQELNIAESYWGNIFLINSQKAITPSEKSGCSKLLVRTIVMRLLTESGFEIEEKDEIDTKEMFNAKEVIIAGESGIYSLKGFEMKRYFDDTKKLLVSKIKELI